MDTPDKAAPTNQPGAHAVAQIRAQAGPAHPLAVWLGRAILHGSRWSRHLLRTSSQREMLVQRGAEFFDVTVADGMTLHACRVPACATPEPHLAIVMTHGWLEAKELHADEAVQLADSGHEVILFDLRAHGNSGGSICSFGVNEQHDVTHVINAAQQRGWIGDRVLTMGYSTGAVTMLHHAVTDTRVAGVLAFAPFYDLEQGITFFRRLMAPKMAEEWLLLGLREAVRRAGFGFDEADTAAVVTQLHIPVLFVSGQVGWRTALDEQVRRLHDAKQHGYANWMPIDGATHFTIGNHSWPDIMAAVEEVCRQARPS